ncbi:MAG TPA: hypothetical protein VIS52_01805 [Motiliproteus sp.]
MTDSRSVSISLSAEAAQLFQTYQTYTGTPADAYIEALVEKTLPTLRALVAALDEANGDDAAVMELFGRKMAEAMLQQQAQQ